MTIGWGLKIFKWCELHLHKPEIRLADQYGLAGLNLSLPALSMSSFVPVKNEHCPAA
jgi:hypothetical protein